MSNMPAAAESPGKTPRLLLCSNASDPALAMQAAVFCDAGYPVQTAATRRQIQRRIETTEFEIAIFNHTLSFADRKLLARKARLSRPESGILVLHHSGALENPHVDLAVDSRIGAVAMLRALRRLEGMMHARSHHSDGFAGPYFVVADAHRNYTFVSDAVCELLGYNRALFLELRIDDIVAGTTPVAAPLFQQFVAVGEQTGSITLRHRSGRLVPVKYWAKVESDGCMLARWEPLEAAKTG